IQGLSRCALSRFDPASLTGSSAQPSRPASPIVHCKMCRRKYPKGEYGSELQPPDQLDGDQQDDCTHGRGEDRVDPGTRADMDMEIAEQPPANERADDAYDDVADDSETGPLHDLG